MKLLTSITSIFLTLSTLLTADVSQSQRDALVAIYNSTNGATWSNSTNWTVGDPCTNSWYGINCNDSNTTVMQITMNQNNLKGSLPSELGDLSGLTYINLYENSLIGEIPSEIGNLSELAYLNLYNNQLTGEIPTEITNLTLLNYIILADNYYIYSNNTTVQDFIDDAEYGNNYIDIINSNNATEDYHALLEFYESTNGNNWTNSTNWKYGDPCLNSWFGVFCENTDTHVIRLQLSGNNLTGTLPLEIDDFENLTNLYLHQNQLTGTIPPKIGNMTTLEDISLDYNNLTGSIPSTIGNLSASLTKISITHNKLSGIIPQEITSLSLVNLYLTYNCDLYSDDTNVQNYIDNVTNGGDYQDILDTNSNDCSNNIAPIIMYLLN